MSTATKRVATSVRLLVAASFVAAVGCRDGSAPDAAACLQISPGEIELGEIAATGQDVTTTLVVQNVSEEPVPVEVIPSCGCLVSRELDFTLSAGEERELPLSFSSYGRVGPFYTEILLRSRETTSQVPVSAVFCPQVFAVPSRILLLPDENGLSGEIAIKAPSDLWPELQIGAEDGEVEIEKVESQEPGFRRYRVTAREPLQSFSPVVLRKAEQTSPVLTIPVVRGAE
jgi:uncharacterized protein DUF1573